MLPLAASLANGAVPAAACTVLTVDQRGGNGKDLLIGGTGHNTLDGGPEQDLCIGLGDTKISC